MDYLKKNKIFVFLVGIMCVCLLFLVFQLLNTNSSTAQNPNPDNGVERTKIASFGVELTKQLDLRYNWNISLGDDTIERMEIFHGDRLIRDVSEQATYAAPFMKSGLPTGNNEFTFKLTLDNDQVIQKSTYLYINEAFDFKVVDSKQDNKIVYTVNYYYEKQKPVTPPKVVIRYNQNVTLPMSFIKNETISDDGNFIRASSIYELDLTNAIPGSYVVNATWTFDEYNLNYESENRFEIFDNK